MKKNIKRIIISIYFILLSCVFLTSAFSKNLTELTGGGQADLARIKLNINLSSATKQLTNLSNTYQNIAFTVNNFDGTKTNPTYNDIEYKYQIAVTTNKNIPIQYNLYSVKNNVKTKVTMTNGKSQNFTMPHSQTKEDEFILEVKMDNANYKKISDVININVYAVQS